MSNYVECKHDLTYAYVVSHRFGDLCPLNVHECIDCRVRFVKNQLLAGGPVEPLDSPLARAWLAGYPTVETHLASQGVK